MSHKVEKFVKLNSGYFIPSIGLGTWRLPPQEAPELVYQALKKGYRHIDTAIFYENEKEVSEGISRWLKEDPVNNKREDVFYTSKLWTFNTYSQAQHEISKALNAVESNIGYIDLLLLHSPIAGPVGRLEAWKALQEVVATGKVKSIGVSSWGKEHFEQLYDWDGLKIEPAVNQFEVTPWCMREDLVSYVKSKGIIVQAYSPLAQGTRLKDPTVLKLAKKHGVLPSQVLIRWSLQNGLVPIPKTRTFSRLSENLDVFNFELSEEEVKELNHPDEYDPLDWDVIDHE